MLPQFPQCTESIAADLQIVRARSLRLLLERMENVDRISSRCHVEHAVCTADMNPDLTDSRSDGLHRFPVVGIQCLLDGRRAIAGNARRSRRELPSQMSGLSGIGQAL